MGLLSYPLTINEESEEEKNNIAFAETILRGEQIINRRTMKMKMKKKGKE